MASGTGLYNSSAQDWDDQLLELLGLTKSQLNPLRDQEEDCFPAIGDGAAGNLGSGASVPGIFAINFGTSAAVRTVPHEEVKLPFGLFRFVIDRHRALLGGAVSNAGNLRAWCLRELRVSPNDRALSAAAERAARLTILPFWIEERAPTWPENIRGVVLGLTQATTAADLLYATTAAVCHRLAEIFDLLESVNGPSKKIVVSGGILQSPASLQILADSLGREILICADQEASLRGAAVHALEQTGHKVPPPRYGRRFRPGRKASAAAAVARQQQVELEERLTIERF